MQANKIEALAAGSVAVHCGEYLFLMKLICDLVEGYRPLQKHKHSYKRRKIFTKKWLLWGSRSVSDPAINYIGIPKKGSYAKKPGIIWAGSGGKGGSG
jgi:hypothetical protein